MPYFWEYTPEIMSKWLRGKRGAESMARTRTHPAYLKHTTIASAMERLRAINEITGEQYAAITPPEYINVGIAMDAEDAKRNGYAIEEETTENARYYEYAALLLRLADTKPRNAEEAADVLGFSLIDYLEQYVSNDESDEGGIYVGDRENIARIMNVIDFLKGGKQVALAA